MNEIFSINPQLILLFDKNGELEKKIFLSYENISTSSYVYSFYNLNKHLFNVTEDDFDVLQTHIPLTYNLAELRGHLLHILDLEEPVVVYSPYNNIDYSYNNIEIFNPFIIVNETSIQENNDNVVLYNVYKKNLVNGAIFCVLRGKDSIVKSLGRYSTFNKNKVDIIYKIIKNIYENKYELRSSVKDNSDIELDCTLNTYFNILKIKGYSKAFYWNYKKDIYVNGNISRLQNSDNKVLVFLKDNEEIFKINNDFLLIENRELFSELKKDGLFEFKNKRNKSIIIIDFETHLNTNVNFDFDFDFFVELKKGTQNIFSDRTNNIQIIISKDHISYRSNIFYNIELFKYFTAVFLGYSHITNKIKRNRTDIKVNELYTSRYCQNTKTHERKPRIIFKDSLDMNEYNVINESFLEGKILEDKKKIGDVYIDKNNFCYKCFDPTYPYISFVSNFAYSVSDSNSIPCIPCCFSKNKSDTNVFNRCIFKDVYEEDMSNYIQNYGRIITSDKKSSFLPVNIDNIINDKEDIKYNIQKKILFANNYSIVKKCDLNIDNVQIEDFSDIYSLSEEFDSIIIDKDSIYIHPDVLENYIKKNIAINLIILVQNRVHVVKDITLNATGTIEVKDVKKKKIKKIIDLFFKNFYDEKIIKHDKKNNLMLTNNGFFFNENKVDFNSNLTFFKLPNIEIENGSTSSIINEYYKNYFNSIYTEDIDIFKKTFILNSMLNLNEINKINSESEKKRIIEKINLKEN